MSGTEAVVLEVAPAPETLSQPLLAGATGNATLNGKSLSLTGVRGEMGTVQEITVALPSGVSINNLSVNGTKAAFRQDGSMVSAKLRFAGVPFAARQQVGSVDPAFGSASYQAEIAIPARVFKQLEARKQTWPVDYTEAERAAVWLNSDRLLLYINIAELNDEKMTDPILRINGQAVPVKRAYTAIVKSNPRNTFTGWYADVSSLKPDTKYTFAVELPPLAPGQFLGLYFDTVEAEYTDQLARQ
jgi:hypothetical protein